MIYLPMLMRIRWKSPIINRMRNPSFSKEMTAFWCLFLLTGMNLLNYLNRHFLSAVLSPVKDSLHLADGDLGRIATLFMLGYTLSSPIFGILGDRWNRKSLIFSGVLLWSLATLATGFAQNFWELATAQVFVGIGQALFSAVSPSLFPDVFKAQKRNNALTIFFVAIPLGSALSYVLGGVLDGLWGWRMAFYLSAIPGLVLALAFLFFREPRRGQLDEAPSNAAGTASWREMLLLFKYKDYTLNSWGYTAYHFALGAYAFWGPTFLFRSFQIPFQKASMMFGAALVLTGLIGTLLGGYWATSWQKKSPGGYAWVCALSNYATIPFSMIAFWSSNQVVALVAIVLSMFFAFLPTGPMNTLVVETSPTHLRSTGMALSMFLIHMCGDMWSPEIVGRVADSTGRLEAGLSILPVAFLLAALLWTRLALWQSKTLQSLDGRRIA